MPKHGRRAANKTQPLVPHLAEEGEPTYGTGSLLALPLITAVIYFLQPNTTDGMERFGIAFCGSFFVFLFGLCVYHPVREYINRRKIEKNAHLPDAVKEALSQAIAKHTLYPEDVRKWLALNHRIQVGAIESEYWWLQLRPVAVEPGPQVLPPVSTIREATFTEILIMILFYALAVMLFSSYVLAATLILDIFLPFWAAIVLAIPIAVVAFIMVHIGDSTVMEFAVKYIIYLALVLPFIGPLMSRHREIAERQKVIVPSKRIGGIEFLKRL